MGCDQFLCLQRSFWRYNFPSVRSQVAGLLLHNPRVCLYFDEIRSQFARQVLKSGCVWEEKEALHSVFRVQSLQVQLFHQDDKPPGLCREMPHSLSASRQNRQH